jgi:hypothetical protein
MVKKDPSIGRLSFDELEKRGYDVRSRRSNAYHMISRLVKRGYVDKLYTDQGVRYKLKDEYENTV